MHNLDVLRRRIIILFCSVIAYLKIYLWKVKVGKGFRVHGGVYFRRLPGSTIIIGENCIVNSSFRSNLIGIK